MNKIWVIARKDISEAFRSRSTYVIIIIMIILTISYISGYESNVKTPVRGGTWSAAPASDLWKIA
jgi:ABC-type transport system involved in multi-copper enzyme maturation permease subunit